MRKYIQFGMAVAAISLLTACHGRHKSEDENAPREIEVAEVFTDSVILHKTYPGYLEASSTANVMALVNGRIIRQDFSGGTFVRKGQLLFQIDPCSYQDAVHRAEAALASAQSQLEYARSRCEAVKKAYEAEAVSKMEVLSSEATVQQSEADVKDCKAALHTAQTSLGYCNIVSPIDGYISDAIKGKGDYANGSTDAPMQLAKIYDNTKMNAIFEIEDAQYEKMVGRTTGIDAPLYQNIPLKFRDNLLHQYTARLAYEAPALNKNTGTILFKGEIKNINNELRDGMYVTIDLPYGEDPDAMLIKDASIGTDQLGKYVYVVNDSNKVVYTPIKVGSTFRDSLRIVESGLKPGDRYVSKALLTVRNGETVKPVLKK